MIMPPARIKPRPAQVDSGTLSLKTNRPTKTLSTAEEGDINAHQFREIPFDRVGHQAVATQGNKTGDNECNIAPSQAAANRRITADLQKGCHQKNQPRHNVHSGNWTRPIDQYFSTDARTKKTRFQ